MPCSPVDEAIVEHGRDDLLHHRLLLNQTAQPVRHSEPAQITFHEMTH
jgi:hypothetical protein